MSAGLTARPSRPAAGRREAPASANPQLRLRTVRLVHRRNALRIATTLTAGVLASACDGPPPRQAGSSPAGTRSSRAATPGTPAAGSPRTVPDEISHGPRDSGKVALTFHAQGDPVLVGQLLDEVDKADAHITVLAVGAWLTTQADLAHRILDGGHELGNHTQHHRAISRMTPAQAYAEISE